MRSNSILTVARTDADLVTLRNELGESTIPWVMDANECRIYSKGRAAKRYRNIGEMNFGSFFRTTQAVTRNMLQRNTGGSVVNITSQMGHVGSPNRSLYCATKHAVEGLTKALGVEHAAQGIRVNSVAPTFVDTPMTRPMLDNPEFNDFVMSKIPMGKLAEIEDVAAAVVYLASDLARMVTATSLLVDGGWTAQ